jgi:tRNA dimethylallyltransferase
MKKFLIVICGPTGIGKTQLAIEIAKYVNCEIISADSRQVFREMSIGTAVPSEDELKSVPHHFMQSHSIHDNFNASIFEQEVLDFLEYYFAENDVCIMVGGSGLYINAVCEGIDELPSTDMKIRKKWQNLFEEKGLEFLQSHLQKIDPLYYKNVDKENPKRILKAIEIFEMTGKPYSSFLEKDKKPRSFQILKIGLNTDRSRLYDKINKRVDQMLNNGLLDEAISLHPYKNLTPLNTVGYKELFNSFEGKISIDEAHEQIKNHSRAYARRQLSWFRRDKDITWFEPKDIETIKEFIKKSINKQV